MSLWNVLQGAFAQANPFDNGKTYGSYNPSPKKKADQFNQSPQTGVQTTSPQNNIPTTNAPLDFGKLQFSNKVSVPVDTSLPSNAEIALKSAGAVGSNVAGGIIGAVKGLVTLPSFVANATNLAGYGVARLTGNKEAADNAAKRIQNNKFANGYNDAVSPVTDRLTNAELATDQSAKSLAPWQTNVQKNSAKVLANLIPVDAAVSGVAGVSKLRGAKKLAEETTAGVGTPVVTDLPSVPNVIKIPVKEATSVPVNDVSPNAVRVPVTKTPSKLIQEAGGDAKTSEEAAQKLAEETSKQLADRFDSQGTPSNTVQDVTPRSNEPFNLSNDSVANNQQKIVQDYADMLRSMGEGNGTQLISDGEGGYIRTTNNVRSASNKGKKMSKADWQAEAEAQLKAGKAESSVQKAFDDAANPDVQSMLNNEPAPNNGTPINVKQVNPIDVKMVDNVPANLPETPNTVRPTTKTNPVATQSEAIAAQTPTSLPKEVQAVLDNPKQYNKRQVAAARNQLKLAKKLAKTKAETQAVIDGAPTLAPRPEGNPGFVPTGEFRKGTNGNISEVAHAETEAAQGARDTATMSASDVLKRANEDIATGGRVSPESVRNMQAMLESGRFSQTSEEYRALAKTLYGAGSDYGRGLSLFNPTLRRTASGDQLTNRFVSKIYGVSEDASKLSEGDIAMVKTAEDAFTNARDVANQALDRYNATKDAGDFAAWKNARQAADDAEKEALITEFRVAKRVLKGNKNPEALKAIQKAQKEAGVYQMDWIDSSMLSSTGTFMRNYVNTSLVRLENRIFGGRGYSSKGAKLGNEMGNKSVVSDFKARNELDQSKLAKFVKQWSTTGNTLGEGNIKAVGTARAYKFYEKQLKAQGITGDQLARDTEVMLHTDPQGMEKVYTDWALSENALSSLARSKKIEQALAEALAGHGHGELSQNLAKAAVRLTVGFPTVIGKSLVGGAKRATLGVPDLINAGRQFAKGDTQAMKDALYAAKVHGGSGATLYALGTGLAEAGLISPSYPSDPAEQARWKAEGIQPNSIKIGGQWFSIPGYFGSLALPLVIPANVINKTSAEDMLKGIVSGINDLAPTAGIVNFVNGVEGNSGKQWVKNEITSLTRAFTPMGSLLNEIAKMTDPTKNDTTTKDGISNLIDSIASGIPGVNNMVNKTPATDANGNVLHNPNPIGTFFGAQGSEQPQGNQETVQAQNDANATYAQLKDYGVLDNSNLMGLVDKKIQAQISRGQDLTPEQIQSVEKSVSKGITTGITADSDSNWREKGDYATDRAATQVKLALMEADPTAKNSEINNLKIQIARDNVLEQNKIPYEFLQTYQRTSQSEWAKMGDPTSKTYNPDLYNQLANIDKLLTEVGGSYSSDPSKNKYDVSSSGSGSGKKMSTSFGTLSNSNNPMAPKVREYKTANFGATSNIPVISAVQPNIVHKISVSNG